MKRRSQRKSRMQFLVDLDGDAARIFQRPQHEYDIQVRLALARRQQCLRAFAFGRPV